MIRFRTHAQVSSITVNFSERAVATDFEGKEKKIIS